MSIIHDALKKVEKNIQKDAPENIPAPKSLPGLKKTHVPSFIAVVFLVFAAAGLLLWQRQSRQLSSQKIAEKKALQRAPVEIRIPINGIAQVEGKNVVLIGDQIYEAGDEWNGMTIREIGPDQVVVDDQGAARIIRVMP